MDTSLTGALTLPRVFMALSQVRMRQNKPMDKPKQTFLRWLGTVMINSFNRQERE